MMLSAIGEQKSEHNQRRRHEHPQKPSAARSRCRARESRFSTFYDTSSPPQCSLCVLVEELAARRGKITIYRSPAIRYNLIEWRDAEYAKRRAADRPGYSGRRLRLRGASAGGRADGDGDLDRRPRRGAELAPRGQPDAHMAAGRPDHAWRGRRPAAGRYGFTHHRHPKTGLYRGGPNGLLRRLYPDGGYSL